MASRKTTQTTLQDFASEAAGIHSVRTEDGWIDEVVRRDRSAPQMSCTCEASGLPCESGHHMRRIVGILSDRDNYAADGATVLAVGLLYGRENTGISEAIPTAAVAPCTLCKREDCIGQHWIAAHVAASRVRIALRARLRKFFRGRAFRGPTRCYVVVGDSLEAAPWPTREESGDVRSGDWLAD